MHHLPIKALSSNKCWQGRRFKTNYYKEYEKEVVAVLPHLSVPDNQPLKVSIIFGYSNKLSDVDNGLKPFLDILQGKYMFNDRLIYILNVQKDIVSKGQEYIKFKIDEVSI